MLGELSRPVVKEPQRLRRSFPMWGLSGGAEGSVRGLPVRVMRMRRLWVSSGR